MTAALQHTPGEIDAPVRDVRGWRASDLDDVRDHVSSVVRLMYVPTASTFLRRGGSPISYSVAERAVLHALAREAASRGGPNQLLRRGAMLHTDIAMLAPPELEPRANDSRAALQQRTVYLSDGRTVAVGDVAGHWEMARSLLDRLASGERGARLDPARDPFVRVWYRAVARFMLFNHKLWLPHFDRALQLFPDDEDLLFLTGGLHETLAAPRIQDAVNGSGFLRIFTDFTGQTMYYDTGVRSEGEELRRAEGWLRRALLVDAAHLEARIRLGRVLTLRDRPREAVTELRAAASAVSEPLLRYFAALFLGRAAEATGDLHLARQSYDRAQTLYPRAQSPALALSRLATATGENAARRVADVLGGEAAEGARDDPWWRYHSSIGRHADAQFEQLHAMLLAGDRP